MSPHNSCGDGRQTPLTRMQLYSEITCSPLTDTPGGDSRHAVRWADPSSVPSASPMKP